MLASLVFPAFVSMMIDVNSLFAWCSIVVPLWAMSYTNPDMQQLRNNRYVRMAVLGIALATAFYLIIWLTLSIVGMADFPQFIQLMLAILGAGLVVYKFFSYRIG